MASIGVSLAVGAVWRAVRAMRVGRVDDEAGGVDLAVDLEVEEQGVGPGGRDLDREADRPGRLVAERVDVEVGEVAVAQGHEVAGRAEVRLGGHDRRRHAAR